MLIEASEPRPSRSKLAQAFLTGWMAVVFQMLGLIGVAVQIVMMVVGGVAAFEPVFFGGSIGAASGGTLANAYSLAKKGKE